MDALDIDGAWVFTPRIYSDRRGTFLEWFRDVDVQAVLARSFEVAQANCSVCRRGVIHGIHFADVPPGQAEYVTCVSGAERPGLLPGYHDCQAVAARLRGAAEGRWPQPAGEAPAG